MSSYSCILIGFTYYLLEDRCIDDVLKDFFFVIKKVDSKRLFSYRLQKCGSNTTGTL